MGKKGTKKSPKLKFASNLPDELDLVVEVVGADAGARVDEEDEVDLLPRMLPKLTHPFLQNSAEDIN